MEVLGLLVATRKAEKVPLGQEELRIDWRRDD